MSAEHSKLVMQRIYDAINTGNLERVDEVLAVDVIEHSPLPGTDPGLEGFKQSIKILRTAFPDLHFTIDDMIAEGDLLAARYTMRGTYQGEFMGIPPTGKQVTFSSMEMNRIIDGKVAEHWFVADMLGLLQQLGAVPTPG